MFHVFSIIRIKHKRVWLSMQLKEKFASFMGLILLYILFISPHNSFCLQHLLMFFTKIKFKRRTLYAAYNPDFINYFMFSSLYLIVKNIKINIILHN